MHGALGIIILVSALQLPSLELTEKGLGPLTPDTPFSVPAIQKLLPNLRVIASESSTEGILFPIIKVTDGQTELFAIGPSEDGKHIFSFVVSSSRITLRDPGRIGSTYTEVFGNKVSDLCSEGKEELTGKVICKQSPTSHIRFLFDGKTNTDGMPPIAVLKTMRVKEILWHKD
jgi:hypothetical protein